MNHFYKNIQGYFDFEDVYSSMVKRFPSGSHFIEIGSWRGKSAAYMGVEIINSKKDITLTCIDNWKLEDDIYDLPEFVDPGKAYKDFQKNISRFKGKVTYLKLSSQQAAICFKDETIDFVYIDGSHLYKFVKKDIELWYPKVKIGGVIAGHDRSFEGVKKAVEDYFKGRVVEEVGNASWLYNKIN